MPRICFALRFVLCLSLGAASAADAEPAPGYRGVGVFEMPALTRDEQNVAIETRTGYLAAAAAEVDKLTSHYPEATHLHILQAAIAAARGAH